MNKQFTRAGFGASLVALGGAASAAVPESVTTAITTMQADAITVATAVLVAIIAVLAIKFIRKGM